MSFSISLRRSPKPGAFTAATLSVPRSLFTTSVASASPSTSSATMRMGRPVRTTCSSSGMRSAIALIFFSVMRMKGSSSSTTIRAGSVTKYGEMYPRSNCMPSTTFSVVSRPLASSTVITPSLPTFSMASAMMLPMVSSPLEEMAPTWAISVLPWVFVLSFFSSSTTAVTACSMPRLSAIGLWPAATRRIPSP